MTALLLLIVAFVLASACFSGFENGMMSVRPARVAHAIEKGSGAAKLMRYFLSHPAQMLATILLGNNLCNCFAAIFFDDLVELYTDSLWWSATASGALTIVVLLLGEVTPKVWFRQAPFVRCRQLVYPIYFFNRVAYPAVAALTWITRLISRLLGGKEEQPVAPLAASRDDFRLMLLESEEAELIHNEARRLLEKALDFSTQRVYDVMVPHASVVTVNVEMTLAAAVAVAGRSDLSRLPVTEGDSKQWIGMFNIYDALFRVPESEWPQKSLRDYLRPIVGIPESAPLQQVLSLSRSTRSPLLVALAADGRQTGVISAVRVSHALVGEVTT